jgi:hypothetical protein
MPAKDRYHDAVVRALVKNGWTITTEQMLVRFVERRLWIDIQAAKASEQLVIVVEVKGFESMPSPVDYLADAVGKYVIYLCALDYARLDARLYMVVPIVAYEGILNEEIGRRAIRKANIDIMVFDPEREEVIRWSP